MNLIIHTSGKNETYNYSENNINKEQTSLFSCNEKREKNKVTIRRQQKIKIKEPTN